MDTVFPPAGDLLLDDLSVLANRFGSDKGTLSPLDGAHHGPRLFFTPVYDMFLSALKERPIRVLELGVGSGASLRMWSEYFSSAEIIGADIESIKDPGIPRVNVVKVDQSDRQNLRQLGQTHGPFDVIIDDGGHMMAQQQISLGILFKHLQPGGMYFIEDLHTSFWPYGKYRDLYGHSLDINEERSNTTIEFLVAMMRTGKASSLFLDEEENGVLSRLVHRCLLMSPPDTEYGPNRIALLIRR